MAGNIRQYDTPDLAIRPTDRGVDAVASAARRGGAFFNQAAEDMQSLGQRTAGTIRDAGQVAVDYAQHREISTGATEFATMHAQLTDAWANTVKNADPNDTGVMARFNEKVLQPALQKYQDSFLTEGGQRWAQQHVDALRNHMFERGAADMSSLAGDAVATNVRKMSNAWSNTARRDPSSVPFLLKSAESSVDGVVSSSPGLTGPAASKVRNEVLQKAKEDIVHAGALGAIEKSDDPEKAANEFAARWPEYVNGPQVSQLAKAAKAQNKANQLTDRQNTVLQRQLDEQKMHADANKAISDNVSIDPQTNQPVVKPGIFKDALELAKNHPNAASAMTTAKALIDWGEHQQRLRTEPIADDPAVKQDLTDRLFSADNPTTRIDLMRAQVAGKLSNSSFQAMERLVTELEQAPLKGPAWHDTMQAVKDELVVNIPGISGKDVVGSANYAKFAQSFIPQYLAKQRAGTLEPNALDVKDPNSMISKAMAPFKRSMADRIADYTAIAGGLAAPGSAPGERKLGDTVVPAPLRGIAALQYNITTKQWRDQTTGKVYDAEGREVAR